MSGENISKTFVVVRYMHSGLQADSLSKTKANTKTKSAVSEIKSSVFSKNHGFSRTTKNLNVIIHQWLWKKWNLW